MPSVLSVNDATAWRTATHVYVNDGGTWRDCSKVSVNDAGAWRDVFTLGVIELGANRNLAGLGAPGFTSVGLSNVGVFSGAGTTSGSFSTTWITPTSAAGANYDVRAVTNVGVPNSGDAMNTFLSLGTSRSWQSGFSGGAGCTFTLEVYRASDHGTLLDSCQIIFS